MLEGWFLRVGSYLSLLCSLYKELQGNLSRILEDLAAVGRDEKLAERVQCECCNSGTCKLDFRIGFCAYV